MGFPAALIGPAVGLAAGTIGSIPLWQEANRLKRERARLLKKGAPGMSPIEEEQMAAARAEAASSLAPGYAQEMEGIAEGQSNILGAAKKAGLTGSNIMNTLSRLNQQGQAARRNLTIRGAQAQRAAKGDYRNIAMNADARRQRRVENWEAQLAAMDKARREYRTKAWMGPIQGIGSMVGMNFGGGATTPTTDNNLPLSLERGVGDFNSPDLSVYNTTG